MCVYRVPEEYARYWRAVAAHLDPLGAWEISQDCECYDFITDSGDLIIERLIGGQFSKYSCNARGFRTATAADRHVAALYA